MAKKKNTDTAGKRKLIFIRHSKAEDHSPEITDYERSLTRRGKVNTMLMAEILKATVEHPGRIISSPAFRALETALIFSREYGISETQIRLAPELYLDIGENEFLPFIRSFQDDDATVTIFGHYPLITEMAS